MLARAASAASSKGKDFSTVSFSAPAGGEPDEVADRAGNFGSAGPAAELGGPKSLDRRLFENEIARAYDHRLVGHRAEGHELAAFAEQVQQLPAFLSADRIKRGDDRGSAGHSLDALLPARFGGRNHVVDPERRELGDAVARRTTLTTWTPRALAIIARVLPTAPVAAFWIIHWPGCTPSSSSAIIADKGIADELASDFVADRVGNRHGRGRAGEKIFRPGTGDAARRHPLAERRRRYAFAQLVDDAERLRASDRRQARGLTPYSPRIVQRS